MQDEDTRHPSTPPSDSNRPRPDAEQVEQPLEDDQVSGTDIVGDETNVRTREGVEKPGIADKVPPQSEWRAATYRGSWSPITSRTALRQASRRRLAS